MILAIDSSGRETMLALAKDGHIHEALLPNRDELLERFKALLSATKSTTAEIAALAIGAGPGSFTGLRVGFAFAHGLARGLDIPLWPVPSFEVMAHYLLPKHSTVTVLVQARKERWFVESFGKFAQPRAVHDAAGLLAAVPAGATLCGPGVTTLPADLKTYWAERITTDAKALRPQASVLISLAQTKWQDREPLKISEALPDYGLEFGAN
ncbi:MAG: tRNA (adenosine(37)-N6)-threonylcarbamoyltransferase complex dimerization subunit type 1 TsaB [bacterium]|nr:tRNA (adenosine(37)-N6)-threonylcarbamoyltransferase complex dimerization subunit type 1 TsaB [bacterium]